MLAKNRVSHANPEREMDYWYNNLECFRHSEVFENQFLHLYLPIDVIKWYRKLRRPHEMNLESDNAINYEFSNNILIKIFWLCFRILINVEKSRDEQNICEETCRINNSRTIYSLIKWIIFFFFLCKSHSRDLPSFGWVVFQLFSTFWTCYFFRGCLGFLEEQTKIVIHHVRKYMWNGNRLINHWFSIINDRLINNWLFCTVRPLCRYMKSFM